MKYPDATICLAHVTIVYHIFVYCKEPGLRYHLLVKQSKVLIHFRLFPRQIFQETIAVHSLFPPQSIRSRWHLGRSKAWIWIRMQLILDQNNGKTKQYYHLWAPNTSMVCSPKLRYLQVANWRVVLYHWTVWASIRRYNWFLANFLR